MQRPPASVALITLICVTVGILIISVIAGSAELTIADAFGALFGDGQTMAHDVIWRLRLPRAMAAVSVGALLAISGALLQVMLRNPLADPYVLGVSGGASVAALIAILLGLPAAGVDGLAALGALAASLLVFALAQGPGGWTPTRLLLTGIVVAAGAGSVVSLLLALSDDTRLRGMVFWLLGDLSRAERWPWLLALAGAATVLCAALGRHLNVLARGELQATTLGMNARRFQIVLFAVTSVLTGVAVSAAGSIGFVGLVTPHLVRTALGNDNRIVLPASALLGGILLAMADLASRLLIAPRQLPVGALTALVGVPLFLVLLSRQKA